MPFTDQTGSLFNCGFCRTLIYECQPKRAPKTKKKSKSACNGQGHATTTNVGEASTSNSDIQSHQGEVKSAVETTGGKENEVTKVCVDVGERFQALFTGPQFALGEEYFTPISAVGGISQFDRHCRKVKDAFLRGFPNVSLKEKYVKAFSSANWEALPTIEKSRHSLSNCVACATQFEELQKLFPLKPFFSTPQDENSIVDAEKIDEVCHQVTGKPLTELVANLGYKSASEVEQIVKQAKKRCIRETQQQCVAEGKKQLEDSALQAAHATDTSFLKFEKMRQVQYFIAPSEAHCSKRKRYPLCPDDCERFDELSQTLINWDPANTLVASELAKQFNVAGTDSSHKIKLLARELNPSIPGSEIVSKPKSSRRKLEGSTLSLPVPPNKKRLLDIQRSMVDSGALKEGVPCIPVKLKRFQNGERVEIEAHSRKFPLVDIRQSLLSAHEQFMRLHSDSEIEQMSREDVLSILQMGARYSMHQFSDATEDELKALLAQFERNRTIWIWHDHSSLASHGILAVMVGVVYDSLVFKTEDEIGQKVQEFIEEGEVHIVAHGSSSLEDQAILIPERLAELEGLTDDVTSSSGIKVVDTLRFFKGDKPAAQFEAGVSCGGNYPCVGCACHRNRFSDFAHVSNCSQRSLRDIQEIAVAGHFGKVPGRIKFYEELSSDQLRMELEKRAVKDYPTDKGGRLAALKDILCGVQRVPAMLLLTPEAMLTALHLSSYCVLACEPLHDLKGYLGAVLRKLPTVIQSSLKVSVSEYLNTLWKKSHLYGCDLRNALIEVAHIFAANSATGPAADFVTCLVQVSEILYSKDSDRSPKQCLQFYNCAFVLHQLHCELFGETSVGVYFHALLVHGPVQHELVCSRSTNVESEERIFKSAEASAKCTDHKPENMLPVVLMRLQSKRSTKAGNPLQSLHESNSRIAQSASRLPRFKGTVFHADFVKKHKYAYQAHLQRVGHFLVQGEGVWWHKVSADGSMCFHDGHDDPEFFHAGPELLHFRNSDMEDVSRRSKACWQEALDRQISLPVIDAIRCYDCNGDVSKIVSPEEHDAVADPEVSFEGSFMLPAMPPPDTSTPLKQHIPEAATVEPLQDLEEHDVQEEVDCVQERDVHTEGYLDLVVPEGDALGPEVSPNPQSILQSSVCKAVAKLVGVSDELLEFDRIRSICKGKGRKALPVELKRHKMLACLFRKQISSHKRSLECRLAQSSLSSDEHSQCADDLRHCLKLIVSLH